MKNLIIIAAVGKNNEIGCNNDLIWRFREDLNFFRDTTKGHYIVMGRKTYESMPKDLPDRRYIVISRELKTEPSSAVKIFPDIETFIDFAKTTREDIYVIGGGMLYRELLPYTDKMVLTQIDAAAPNADTFFPKFDPNEWNVEKGLLQTAGGIGYTRNTYKRKQ